MSNSDVRLRAGSPSVLDSIHPFTVHGSASNRLSRVFIISVLLCCICLVRCDSHLYSMLVSVCVCSGWRAQSVSMPGAYLSTALTNSPGPGWGSIESRGTPVHNVSGSTLTWNIGLQTQWLNRERGRERFSGTQLGLLCSAVMDSFFTEPIGCGSGSTNRDLSEGLCIERSVIQLNFPLPECQI